MTRSRYPPRSRRSNTEDLCREIKVPELLHEESADVRTMVHDGTGYDKLGISAGTGRGWGPGGFGGDWPGWRGPERTGVSRETGLLHQWPPGGPTGRRLFHACHRRWPAVRHG